MATKTETHKEARRQRAETVDPTMAPRLPARRIADAVDPETACDLATLPSNLKKCDVDNATTSTTAIGDALRSAELQTEEGNAIAVFLPHGELPEGYVKAFHKVELNLAANPQLRAVFQRLYYGLNQGHYLLASGRHIDSAADVLRYILEQCASAPAPVQSPA